MKFQMRMNPWIGSPIHKVGNDEITLPVIRMPESRQGAKGVHVTDLAAFIDSKREAAVREARALQS